VSKYLISHPYLLVLAQKLWLAGDSLIGGLTFGLLIIFLFVKHCLSEPKRNKK